MFFFSKLEKKSLKKDEQKFEKGQKIIGYVVKVGYCFITWKINIINCMKTDIYEILMIKKQQLNS